MFRRGTKRPRFSVGGHAVFEHDDSSSHSGFGMMEYEEDSSSQQLTTSNSDSNILLNQNSLERPKRVQKMLTKFHTEDNTHLNACLDHLLLTLSRKDKEGFFQYPVTDQFAPGYSQIITRPMDFSTMKKKITQDDYSNVIEFRSDFELMCENAMKYNRPDTIYWRAAKKLLATGAKLMNKDKLLSFRRGVECFTRLSERELGFRIDSSSHSMDEQTTSSNDPYDSSINDPENLSSTSLNQSSVQRKPKLILKLPKFYEKPPTSVVPEEEDDEELSPEETLAQAKQASQCAREKLRLHRSLCSYTLAYQRKKGSTSLRFVNQDDLSQQNIALVELDHLLTNEDNLNISSALPIVTDDVKRNHLSAKEFLENGPFSSNSSQHDSTFSSVSKEEVDLLIHAYGSEFSAQYAVSLMDYVKDAGDLALAYVDRFLSVLTNGEHDNLVMKKREKQPKLEESECKIGETAAMNNVPSIDSMSSADEIKLEPQIHTHLLHPQSDTKLDENSNLHIPFNRLSQSSSQLHQVISLQQTDEQAIGYDSAEKVLFNFNDLTSLSNGPEKLITSESIHHNLGIISNNEPLFDKL
ncbi:unnamed protein product [Rotaria magnacalcarata]|uniref:Bromo domain-containing protein n=1 Tax=Rotaria magnacalcarata TaxID=392030 RepID=A0A816M4W8_9BILA|nr:unnamed protein product [Rotaria magnacalcarata]